MTGELHSLGEIKRQLGHAGRRLTLVKADCEGCEWGWLAFQLREDAAALASIDQLHLELHLSKSLRFDDAALSNAPTTFRLRSKPYPNSSQTCPKPSPNLPKTFPKPSQNASKSIKNRNLQKGVKQIDF